MGLQMARSLPLLPPWRATECGMTLRIERASDEFRTTIRLIGRMQAEHLDELKAQIEQGGSKVALDLREVRLVDVEAIRFLGSCQAAGIQLVHCPPYISEWIKQEQGGEKPQGE
jgi:hypothetical protein